MHSIKKNIIYLKRDGINLALHSWIPTQVKAVLFYIHGVQSHAGWLYETGNDIAKASIAVFAMDRRGCGLSEGIPGDIPSADCLLDDYYFALSYVKEAYPEIPLTLMGYSLGGSILAGLVCRPHYNINYDAIVFGASALGKNHSVLTASEQQQIMLLQDINLKAIPLHDTDYTDDEKYLTFIQEDKLGNRFLTNRSRSTLLAVEKYYWNQQGKISKPAAFFYPNTDPMIDIPMAIRVFKKLTDEKGILVQFSGEKHYLWFMKQRNAVAEWLSHFILTRGYQ